VPGVAEHTTSSETRVYATRVDRFLAPYVTELGLLPVTLVLVAHVVLGIAVATLEAWRSTAGFAVLGLVLMGGASLVSWFFDWRHGRVGIVGGTWLLCWPLGVTCAWLAARWELY
jgi:hypothetical protein